MKVALLKHDNLSLLQEPFKHKGRATTDVSVALSNEKEVLEIGAEMFYSVTDGEVWDDCEVSEGCECTRFVSHRGRLRSSKFGMFSTSSCIGLLHLEQAIGPFDS